MNGIPGYRTVETDELVGEPEFVTRFRWRAERRRRQLQEDVRFPFYRWEVVRVHDQRRGKRTRWRWAVVAMQNVAVPE